MGVAYRAGAVRLRSSPREPALRHARLCYNHLAGDKGVQIFDSLIRRGFLITENEILAMTKAGEAFFREFGIKVDAVAKRRRPLCRGCLDWSARRHHLAGGLGAALLAGIFELGWARCAMNSRVEPQTAGSRRA